MRARVRSPPAMPSPPVLSRSRWLVAALTTALFVVWLSLPFTTSRVPTLIYITCPLTLFAPLLGLRARELRIRRRLRASGYRLCLSCGHSLAGIGDAGICPECGRAFVIEADREIWAASELATRTEMRESSPPSAKDAYP